MLTPNVLVKCQYEQLYFGVIIQREAKPDEYTEMRVHIQTLEPWLLIRFRDNGEESFDIVKAKSVKVVTVDDFQNE